MNPRLAVIQTNSRTLAASLRAAAEDEEDVETRAELRRAVVEAQTLRDRLSRLAA